MKVLVCGGRNLRSPAQVFRALDRLHQEKPITELMQGGATGADQFAMEWAATKPEIKRYVCHADWETHGRAAGPIRNEKMLTWKPDLVVAFPGRRRHSRYWCGEPKRPAYRYSVSRRGMKPAPTKQRGRAVRDAAANWFRQKAWFLSDQTVSCCKTLRADTRVASLLVTRFDSGACPPSPAADRLTLPKNAGTSITAMCRSVRSQSVSASRTKRIRGAGIAASIRARIWANIRGYRRHV